MFSELSGYLSGGVILVAFWIYFKDIFLCKTKPQRASWFIWAVLGAIIFSSQLAKGATYSLVMPGVQAIGDLFIFILALKYGIGGFAKRDVLTLIGAAISLVLWYLTKEAAVALFIIIFIDALASTLTVLKVYKNPATESVNAWTLTFISGLFSCLAVGEFNLVLLAFPFYICLASLAILTAIRLGFSAKNKGY